MGSPVFQASMGADRTPSITTYMFDCFDAFSASLELISGYTCTWAMPLFSVSFLFPNMPPAGGWGLPQQAVFMGPWPKQLLFSSLLALCMSS